MTRGVADPARAGQQVEYRCLPRSGCRRPRWPRRPAPGSRLRPAARHSRGRVLTIDRRQLNIHVDPSASPDGESSRELRLERVSERSCARLRSACPAVDPFPLGACNRARTRTRCTRARRRRAEAKGVRTGSRAKPRENSRMASARAHTVDTPRPPARFNALRAAGFTLAARAGSPDAEGS